MDVITWRTREQEAAANAVEDVCAAVSVDVYAGRAATADAHVQKGRRRGWLTGTINYVAL